MKSDYISRAKKFVETIYPYISECHRVHQYMNKVSKFNKEYHRRVEVCFGVSRVALITSDYVIKIDYASEDTIQYYGGCARELEEYEFIKNSDYDYLFAAITKYTYENHDYYIMPRISGIGTSRYEINHYLNEEEFEFIDEFYCDLHESNFGFKNHRPVIIDYACTRQQGLAALLVFWMYYIQNK